jgi:hypothetical protein
MASGVRRPRNTSVSPAWMAVKKLSIAARRAASVSVGSGSPGVWLVI